MIKEPETKSETSPNSSNPLANLFCILAVLISNMIYPSILLSLLILSLILIAVAISGAALKFSSNRIKFILSFSVILLLVQILVTPNGIVLLYLFPRLGELGPSFPVTNFGLEKGLSIALRFLVVVISSMFFVSVTDPTLLAHALSSLGIPYRYNFALVIALRFIPLFDIENQVVRMAQKSRGISIEVGGLSKLKRSLRYTFFPLIISALQRAETLALSMEGRGFGYDRKRAYLRKTQWRFSDMLVIIASTLLLTISVLFQLQLLPSLL
ncbi:energy-coupling factor transporter transmembrane protein EcfT [Candidatus Thorarchaeota archaeon]|nr:MAG: energy-coupling factor transporter transmembrane protein EcfT [Candidatus Thorarchaeota archaeon]